MRRKAKNSVVSQFEVLFLYVPRLGSAFGGWLFPAPTRLTMILVAPIMLGRKASRQACLGTWRPRKSQN